MSASGLLLICAVVMSGLVAGLFFGWSVSVIPGTKRIDDHSYITTMQNINRAIVNPVFLVFFTVTPIVLAATALVHFQTNDNAVAGTLVGATIVYLAGVVAVTAGGNVPLNDALDKFDLATSSTQQVHVRRTSYETRWNQWHNLRTVASILVAVLAAVASGWA